MGVNLPLTLIGDQFVAEGGTMGTELDLRATGRGFKSYSKQKVRNNLGPVVHTYVPLSPS